MNPDGFRVIQPVRHLDAEVHVPPSKSYTNRALIVAALAEGTSEIRNPSTSDDSTYLVSALRQFGVSIESHANCLQVSGTSGRIVAPAKEVFVGNAGTAMRFLATFAGISCGRTILTGDEQMKQRPINDLLNALRMAGIKCSSKDGFPPVVVEGGNFSGGQITIDASISSQFVSSILLTAPYAKRQVSLHVKGKLSSMPYIDMSLHVMRSFGAEVETIDYTNFFIGNTQRYFGMDFHIESDASSASYFLAAAAITGGHIVIADLSPESLQGDIKFLNVLSEMGCTITKHETSVEIRGGKLRGIEIDMNEIPDCVPTLAVVAAFAEGTTSISNVAHLRYKETNRLLALATELSRIGAKVELTDDGMTICPHRLHGAAIETYNDHRMAMSFAIAGLGIQGISIGNPGCVTKSFPGFWDEFEKLQGAT